MLKRHQIRVSSAILLAAASAGTIVANSAVAAPASTQVTARSAAKASSQHSGAQSSKNSKGPAASPKDSTSSQVHDDDESHLHGWIPSGKHSEENVAEPLSMDDDPMFLDPQDAPVVLQEQKARLAFPKGVLQPGDRSDALPHYNLANKYLNQGRFQDAARKYRDAITIFDKDADFYVNLGVALRKLNDYAGAEKAFKQALALNATDWMAWSNLANAYLKQEKLVETVESFRQCLKCKPPAQERVAIEQDIKDITKILRMRAPNLEAKPAAAERPQPKPTAAITPVSPEKLKGTGWDYMYK